MFRKNVKSLLEQLQVCIFAEVVFGVRCTLTFDTGRLFTDVYGFKMIMKGSFELPHRMW